MFRGLQGGKADMSGFSARTTLARACRSAVVVASIAAVSMVGQRALSQSEGGPSVQNIRSNPRPEVDPVGLRFGGFLVLPQVQAGLGYDDNVFATDDDREGDFLAVVTPSLTAASQWNRHMLRFEAFVSQGLYFDNSDEDYLDAGVAVAGRIDYTRVTSFTSSASVNYSHEDRGDPDEAGGDEPTTLWSYEADIGASTEIGRLRFVLQGLFQRQDYNDVDGIDNDDRDYNEYQAIARVGYLIAPRVEGFVQGLYDIRRYDDEEDSAGFERDSEGFGISGGVGFDITNLVAAEVTAGYREQEYEDDDLDTVSGFAFGGSLIWNPTTLTTVEAFAATSIDETTNTGASGSLTYRVGVSVDHELMRNVLLGGSLGYINRDFADIDRTDDVWTARVSADYFANRNLSFGAQYTFRWQESNAAEDYTRSIVMLTATARF